MSVIEPYDPIARLEEIYERLDNALEKLMAHPLFALDVVQDILLIQQVIFTKIREWRALTERETQMMEMELDGLLDGIGVKRP